MMKISNINQKQKKIENKNHYFYYFDTIKYSNKFILNYLKYIVYFDKSINQEKLKKCLKICFII